MVVESYRVTMRICQQRIEVKILPKNILTTLLVQFQGRKKISGVKNLTKVRISTQKNVFEKKGKFNEKITPKVP